MKLQTIHPTSGKFNFDDAKHKRDYAYSRGVGSKEWIELATLMFDQFPFIYNTCLVMNETQSELNAEIAQLKSTIAELESRDKIAHELITYVMGADDYNTEYKEGDCAHVKHFKDLISLTRFNKNGD